MVAASLAILAGLLAASSALVVATPVDKRGDCTYRLKSYTDVANAKLCNNIIIVAQTVDLNKTLDLTGLIAGTHVTVAGDVSWTGGEATNPLFAISGSGIVFDGQNFTFDGKGQAVWDSKGSNISNGGTKKAKFMRVTMDGTFSNLKIINAPVQVFSIGNTAALTIDSVTIDNRAGDAINQSTGLPLAHNTDCFDVSGTSTTIQNSVCYNQDDCLALNKGSNIKFLSNMCSGGHGISIGSIQTGSTVSGVTIKGNTVVKSTNGLRIKTQYNANSASVSSVTYDSNTVTGATQYGVVIEQDYDNGSPKGTAGNGVTIKGVSFTGGLTRVNVASNAKEVYVLCGTGTCSGTWDWSELQTSGSTLSGKAANSKSPDSVPITGYTFPSS